MQTTPAHLAPGSTVYTPARMYGSHGVGTATVVTAPAGALSPVAHIRMRGKLGTLSASTSHLFASREAASGYWDQILGN